MAQSSGWWTSNATGDGPTAGYDQDWVRRKWHALFANGEADHGVQAGYENALAVTTTSAHYHVATGFACVYGFMYENTATVDFDVTSPATSRSDYIVLRADWTTQTVRLAVITGLEGGQEPTLTQTPSTTWEIPLAMATISAGGTITLTDRRGYLGASTGTAESSSATPATLVLRDASARAKMAAPSAATDIAILSTVTDHTALTTAHGAVSAATASKIIVRDASGRAQVAAPSAAADIARLDTITGSVGMTPSAQTAYAAGAVASNNAWQTLGTISSIVTTGTTLLVCLGAGGYGSSGAAANHQMRFVVDGTTTSETRAWEAGDGSWIHMEHHYALSVAAGTHSVVMQGLCSTSGNVVDRRITVFAIKTAA
jgi:hypothetical protein